MSPWTSLTRLSGTSSSSGNYLWQRRRDATSGTNSPYGIRFWQCRITDALLPGITSPAGKARYLLYCSTAQATKATTAIAAMRDKLSASVSTSFG